MVLIGRLAELEVRAAAGGRAVAALVLPVMLLLVSVVVVAGLEQGDLDVLDEV